MKKTENPVASAREKDAREAIQRLGHELHTALFPEEHDHVYDSFSEAKDRLRGISPMNAEYVEKTNAHRAQLGFAPFNGGADACNEGTLAWVLEKLREGAEDELREILARRAREASQTEHQKEQARQQLQTPAWFDQRIDDMLSGESFLYRRRDRADPHVVAFRIMGELFSINPLEKDDAEFFRQIRRVLPDLSEAEYEALQRHALDEWVEAYGY